MPTSGYNTETGLISDNNNPGKSVVIRPDPATLTTPASLALVPAPEGSPVARATLVNLSTSDDKSEIVTIALDNPSVFENPAILSVLPTTSALARTEAIIEWGVNGVQSKAHVDFIHGLSFSIPASFLRITGVNLPLLAHVANINGAGINNQVFGRNVKLGAFCGYGASSGNRNAAAKKTIYWDEPLQFGPTQTFKIPDWATNLQVEQSSTTPTQIVIKDEGGNGITQFTVPAGTFSDVVELPGDAAFITALPNLPTTFAMRFIFGLSF